MYNIGNMRFNAIAKMKKPVSRILLIVFLVVLFLLSGFTEFESDNLYSYQWGLKNHGNFYVDRGILAEDYKVIIHNKAFSDAMFQDNKAVIDYLKSVNTDPGIAFAKENIDTNWEEGYKLFLTKQDKRETIVAVIDSGVDIGHPELIENIWVNKSEIPENGIDDDGNGYIDDYYGYNFIDRNQNVFVDPTIDVHGTHAAGTIVAKHSNGGIRGIAYDSHVKIMPLKILGLNGKGSMSALVEAIRYARNNGANICNISLGAYTYDANLDSVMKNFKDMIFVVAAGNGANFIGYSLDERTVYPAKFEYDNVITVSNICFDGNRYVSANYGSYVDIFAPGTFILSTTPGNNYGYLTGTSMAAPFVSATCAMIYSAFPNVSLSQYKNILINSSTKLPELTGICKSSGMLNIHSALLFANAF